MRNFKYAATLATAAGALAAVATDGLAADYYSGKTLTIITGTRAGGGSDTTLRLMQPFLTKYIAGNPKIVVKNLTGGGGQKAWNFVYEKGKPDGSIMIFSAWNPVGRVTGSPGLRADYSKMNFITGQAIPRMSYMITGGKDNIKTRDDLLTAKHIVLAGNRPSSVLDLSIRISFEMLGIDKYIYVPGLNPPKAFASLRAGETNLTTTGVNFYRGRVEPTLVKSGKAIALFYYPSVGADGTIKKSPHIKDMPSIVDYYRKVKGKEPSGLAWDSLKWMYLVTGNMIYTSFTPPGTGENINNALRAGFQKSWADPAFGAKLLKTTGLPPESVGVVEGKAIIKSVDSVDPKVVAYFKKMIGPRKKKKKK
jgi:hypothetical protein